MNNEEQQNPVELNREGRRKYYKENHKQIGLSWIDWNIKLNQLVIGTSTEQVASLSFKEGGADKEL